LHRNCKHCDNRKNLYSRGLCRTCWKQVEIRERYKVDKKGNQGQGLQKPCLHCERVRVLRARGLCWICYYQPEIKDLYGPVSSLGRRSSFLDRSIQILDSTPTDAPAGSEEKIRVMTERASRGVSLFHPLDSKRIKDEKSDD
jgi:hypothetical protein